MNKLYEKDEKTILLLLKNDDQRAFEHLYANYSNRIYGKILRLTKSESVADEILQDTFVKLWEKRQLINENFPVKAWIYRIAENEVYMFYRRLSRDRKLQEHIISTFNESYSPTEKEFFLKESRELLNHAIDQLPGQCREVFKLCRIEGKSYEETGNILGISPYTVSNHLVKASKSIRNYIFQTTKEDAPTLLVLILCAYGCFFR